MYYMHEESEISRELNRLERRAETATNLFQKAYWLGCLNALDVKFSPNRETASAPSTPLSLALEKRMVTCLYGWEEQ